MTKHRLFFKFLSAVLCACMLLTACAGTSAAPKSYKKVFTLSDTEAVTMSAAADYLLTEAAKYNKNVPSREDLIDNFSGLKETDKAPRNQVLSMVSRAFGSLPAPTGNNARIAPKSVDLSKVPEWLQEDLEKLNAAGILAESDLSPTVSSGTADLNTNDKDAISEPSDDAITDGSAQKDTAAGAAGKDTSGDAGKEDVMTGQELKNIVRRIYALYGTNLKDDFYTAINKNALDTKEIPAGETDAGGTYDQRIIVQNQINSIIKKIVDGSGYAPDSKEAKIKAFYDSAVDFNKRNALGAKPIQKYIDAIDKASDLSELTEAQVLSIKEIASGGLISFMYINDPRHTQKIIPTLMPPMEPMEPMDLDDMKAHYIKLLMLTGETEREASEHVKAYFELQQTIGKAENITFEPEYVTLKVLQEMLPGIDVKAILTAGGDEIPNEICIMSASLFKAFGKLMQDQKNMPAIKTLLKLNIINETYAYLSHDFLDAYSEYNQLALGERPSNSTPEEIAYAMVQNTLGDYIDQLYVKQYFSKEAKEAVEKMVQEFIQVYKSRIEKLDWMSAETKAAAIRKLDNMKFFIGYPDTWDHTIDQLEITDNYFQNQINALKLVMQRNRNHAESQNRGERKADMKIPVATVNAYYDQHTNTMCFPAGILQAPAFDVNTSLEENLGGIGATIAHEISHAFDNQGAKFDENGLQKDWWAKADYEKFQALCQNTERFYDGWESAPGIAISGSQTLGENIADIGGVACALEVLKKTEKPDYDKFFRAYAQGWLKCTTRERSKSLAEIDEHSPGNLRVNRVLSNFKEFYDTYQIGPEDGMYVPEAERIHIW